MKICMDCGEQFSDSANYCAVCGAPIVAVVVPAATDDAGSDSDKRMGIIGRVLAAPAMLIGLFVAVCIAITYYAGVVALALSFGLPIITGIVAATLLLIAVAAVWYLVTRARSSRTTG